MELVKRSGSLPNIFLTENENQRTDQLESQQLSKMDSHTSAIAFSTLQPSSMTQDVTHREKTSIHWRTIERKRKIKYPADSSDSSDSDQRSRPKYEITIEDVVNRIPYPVENAEESDSTEDDTADYDEEEIELFEYADRELQLENNKLRSENEALQMQIDRYHNVCPSQKEDPIPEQSQNKHLKIILTITVAGLIALGIAFGVYAKK